MQEAEVVERLREAAERTGDQDFSESASLIERQQQVIDLLMKAVEPFKNSIDVLEYEGADDEEIGLILLGSDLTAKHLRRAREAKLEAEKILNSTPSTAL
jgi:D-lyxose ketol-isomerase